MCTPKWYCSPVGCGPHPGSLRENSPNQDPGSTNSKKDEPPIRISFYPATLVPEACLGTSERPGGALYLLFSPVCVCAHVSQNERTPPAQKKTKCDVLASKLSNSKMMPSTTGRLMLLLLRLSALCKDSTRRCTSSMFVLLAASVC